MSKARLLGDIYETALSSIGLPVSRESCAIAMFRLVIAEGRSLIRQMCRIICAWAYAKTTAALTCRSTPSL